MRNERLKGLYAITDSVLIPNENFESDIALALRGGASIIQYRDKSSDTDRRIHQANILRQLCDQYSATLIINDDVDLALQCDADGVHLGSEDDDLSEVRERDRDLIIGVSCYADIDAAIDAESRGADYVAFGSIYPSSTKPEAPRATLKVLNEARRALSLPVCAIGGIDLSNAREVLSTGVDMIAVISGLFANRDILQQSEALSRLFR